MTRVAVTANQHMHSRPGWVRLALAVLGMTFCANTAAARDLPDSVVQERQPEQTHCGSFDAYLNRVTGLPLNRLFQPALTFREMHAVMGGMPDHKRGTTYYYVRNGHKYSVWFVFDKDAQLERAGYNFSGEGSIEDWCPGATASGWEGAAVRYLAQPTECSDPGSNVVELCTTLKEQPWSLRLNLNSERSLRGVHFNAD